MTRAIDERRLLRSLEAKRDGLLTRIGQDKMTLVSIRAHLSALRSQKRKRKAASTAPVSIPKPTVQLQTKQRTVSRSKTKKRVT